MSARIEEELEPAGADLITALRAPAIRRSRPTGGPLQLSLFDERDPAEIESSDYPGERLVVCRNPALAEERARKRSELLAATERELERIEARIRRTSRRPRAPPPSARRRCVLGRRKAAKHFRLTVSDDELAFARDDTATAAEAALDGFYVLRTSAPAETLDAGATVRAYKSLAEVERAFRSSKTVDLDIRPVFHWTAPRVRAHASSACSPITSNGPASGPCPRPVRRRRPRRRRG